MGGTLWQTRMCQNILIFLNLNSKVQVQYLKNCQFENNSSPAKFQPNMSHDLPIFFLFLALPETILKYVKTI